MSLSVAEDWPKQRSNPSRQVPHRADKQDLSGRPLADQGLFPNRRLVGMYESQASKARNLKASSRLNWSEGFTGFRTACSFL